MSDQRRKTLLDELARAEARLTELTAERDQTGRQIARLRAELSALDESTPEPLAQVQASETPSKSSEKVALFRQLFRGRIDVFPKRWVNTKKGTAGYAPA